MFRGKRPRTALRMSFLIIFLIFYFIIRVRRSLRKCVLVQYGMNERVNKVLHQIAHVT